MSGCSVPLVGCINLGELRKAVWGEEGPTVLPVLSEPLWPWPVLVSAKWLRGEEGGHCAVLASFILERLVGFKYNNGEKQRKKSLS